MKKNDLIKFFSDFVALKSISMEKKYKKEIEKTVVFLEKKLNSLNFQTQIIKTKNGKPFILAWRFVNNKAPTIAFYGHYDVQPADPLEEWKTDPFKLTLKNGKFWGRGTADNKGHIVINLAAVEKLIRKNSLNSNVIFLIEGEEEMGSPNFEEYVKKAKDIIKKTDVFYLTDVGMHKKRIPQIFYGLRGLVYFELELEIGKRDLHSGVYGNRVINSANLLAEIISKMKDSKTNKILIPHFYDDVRKPSKKELKLLLKTKRSDREELKEAQVYTLVSLNKQNPSLTSKIYPSLDVNGIWAGYTGEGTKTIIPKKATVKFSCRLVEYQKPEKIIKLVNNFISKLIPNGVKWSLKVYDSANPFYTSLDNPWVEKTAKALKEVFGNEPIFNRSGGTIPAAEILQRIFKKPIILTGFTLPDDNIHAPNENFDEESFWKGIETIELLLFLSHS